VSDDDYRLEKRIERIENSELSENTVEFLTDEFLNHVKRSGADSQNTQEIYLRRLTKMLRTENLSIQKLQNLEEDELENLNQEIIDNVQDSEYKAGEGEYSKRTKRSYWGTWKKMLQTIGWDTSKHRKHMPIHESFSTDRSKVDKKRKTRAEDLPDRHQMKKFLKKLGQVSKDSNSLRNQALIGLIWDTGPRVGEVIEDNQIHTIQMSQVYVSGDRIHIKVEGNKNKTEEEKEKSDRKVEIFQCRKLLQEYIQQHPRQNDPEAFLFHPEKHKKHHEGDEHLFTAASKSPIRGKIHQSRKESGLSFKTRNEPFHIFRKGMITYYVMNDILSWEKVCKRTGKDPSSTMPTYLKMALSDINATAAEGFGLDTEERQDEHRMIGPPLLPKNCQSCGKENNCIQELCSSCGTELPDAEMPKGEDFQEDDPINTSDEKRLQEAMQTLEEFKEKGLLD